MLTNYKNGHQKKEGLKMSSIYIDYLIYFPVLNTQIHGNHDCV